MFNGNQTYQPNSTRIFKYAGFVAAAVFMAYLVSVGIKVIKPLHPIENQALAFMIFWWLLLGIYQAFLTISTETEAVLRLFAFHLLAGSTLVLISGINSPLIVLWILLILVSFRYFQMKGFWMSVSALVTAGLAHAWLWKDYTSTLILYNFIEIISMILVGLIITNVITARESALKALDESKTQESLQQERVLTIINNITDAIISTDVDGIIKIYNSGSLALLDTNITLTGQKIDSIVKTTDAEGAAVSILNELQQSQTVTKRDDLYLTFGEDDKIRLEVTFSPIRSTYNKSKNSASRDGYVLIMRDITKEKSLEEERDEFISVVSHELRTPITIAEGTISNVQMMMERSEVAKSVMKQAIDSAHDQVMFLAGMVNDLSTLSRAERGAYDNAEEIDVTELATNLYNKYSDEAKAKKLHFNLDLSAKLSKVYTSRLYIEELLQNLITNAIKYTQKGSVTLAFKQSGNDITFAIKDTGIGISKSDQTKIFNKFYRSEDYRTRETSGTGLGLYIAAKLAKKMNTKIELTSRLNHGSTFSFILPAKEGKK